MSSDLPYDEFLQLHKAQFQNAGLPEHLWKKVYEKLFGGEEGPVYDAEQVFALQYVENEGFRLVANQDLKKESDVYLVDHFWTTTAEYARTQLKHIEGLLDRVWRIADCERRLKEELKALKRQAAAAARAKALKETEERVNALKSKKEQGDNSVEADLKKAEEELNKLKLDEEEAKKETEGEEEIEMPEMDVDAKIEYALRVLAKAGLLGTYFVAKKKGIKANELKQEDVDTLIYLNDEIGSAVRYSSEPNAKLEPLVLVFSRGDVPLAFSLLWLTKDVPKDGIITRERVAVPLPTALFEDKEEGSIGNKA